MSDEPNNIIKLAPRNDRTRVKRTWGSRPHCPHRVALVDAGARILECDACKAPLDPLDFLRAIATEEERDGARERAAAHLDALLSWFSQAGGRLSIEPNGRVSIKIPLPNSARCEFSTGAVQPGLQRIEYALNDAFRRYKAGGVVAAS